MSSLVADNPVIQNCQHTGYPDGKEPKVARCPVCGAECDTAYKTRNGDVVGCGECLTALAAWNVPECFPEEEPPDDYYDGDEPC